ncbi:MAG: ABC transporter permease [Bacteroidota bacterium]
MFKNYLKIAWRNLWKYRSQTLINITGLSIGMAAAVLMILWVQNELSYDAYHPDAERVYRVTRVFKSPHGIDRYDHSSYLLAEFAKKQIPEIEETAQIASSGKWIPLVLNINGQVIPESSYAYVSDSWFSVFKYQFILGNAAAFFSDPHSLLLTRSAAEKYFGSGDNAMGKVLSIDSTNYQVRAIVKDNPANSSIRYDVLLPIAVKLLKPKEAEELHTWGAGSVLTFLKLRRGANPAGIPAILDTIYKRNYKWGHVEHALFPLKGIHFEKDMDTGLLEHDADSKVSLFSILAALLLFTACINYVNLTTAMAGMRVKEVSVKKIVGANRIQIFYQFLTETGLIATISLFASILIMQVCMPFFNNITERNFTFSLVSPIVLVTLFGTLILTVLLSSIYPAILLSSFKPMNLFRGLNIGNIKDEIFRKALVVVQFTISVILISGTIVIYKQQQLVRNSNPAYNRAQIFTINMMLPLQKYYRLKDEVRVNWYKAMKDQLLKHSSIAAVSFTQGEVMHIDNIDKYMHDFEGAAPDEKFTVSLLNADADFQKVFKPQIVDGRWFTDAKGDEDNWVVNEAAVKELGLKQPVIGKFFRNNNINGHIVGVMKDFPYRSLHEPIGALAISNNHVYQNFINIQASPGNIPAALVAAEKVWRQYAPGYPLQYKFMDESFNQLYKSDTKKSTLISLFTGIIIFVSAIGIFGMAIHTSQRRTKEIGIRKILGATVLRITTMLTKDFVYLVLFAIVIATPVAWWLMTKWLQDYAYRIAISWWMFAAAGLIAIIIAVVSVSFKIVKAAMVNPVKSLRNE